MSDIPHEEDGQEAKFSTRPVAARPGSFGEPHLFDGERELFDRVLAAGVQRYLEFGIGGSTLAAIRAGASEVVAVDSDAAWVEVAHAAPEVAQMVSRGSATLIHADIGPVGEWGRPRDRGSIGLWPRYVAKPWAEWARRGSLPDLVYVDGRFRVASVLSVALAFAGRRLGQGGPKILIHDVSDARPGYARIYAACEDVDSVGTLRLLALKQKLDWPTVLATFVESLSNPA